MSGVERLAPPGFGASRSPDGPRTALAQVNAPAPTRAAVSLKQNLETILDLAARRGDRVMLLTFAAYVPDNHSHEGRREYVLHALAVQNEAVRTLAAEHEGVLFVDQARLMAGSPRYFNDPCHFTVVGASRFAENVVAALLPITPRR